MLKRGLTRVDGHGLRLLGALPVAAALALISGCGASALDLDDEETSEDAIATGDALTQKPTVWMPFPSGTEHRCNQGNNGGTSHYLKSTKYALDFDTPNYGAAEPVVAALAGKVKYVKTGCVAGDKNCGGGFGNHVRLAHGGGYFTIYAHLSSVNVATGDLIGRGQLLGHEGTTGNSTGDHVHFSLHQGDPTVSAMPPSVSYVLRARDASVQGSSFVPMNSGSFVCSLGSGHFYASDNACSPRYDSLGAAKTITSNTPYLGEACWAGDVDYFTFSGKAGAFSASVTSTAESIFDCSCAILDAQGVELPPGGPEGYVRNDSYGGTEGCSCSLSNATASPHYLKVYASMPGVYVMNKSIPGG
jgi:peptidase M23-like protein